MKTQPQHQKGKENEGETMQISYGGSKVPAALASTFVMLASWVLEVDFIEQPKVKWLPDRHHKPIANIISHTETAVPLQYDITVSPSGDTRHCIRI